METRVDWKVDEKSKTRESEVNKSELTSTYEIFLKKVSELDENIEAHNNCIDDQNKKIGHMYSNFIVIIVTLLSVGIVFISAYSFLISIYDKILDFSEINTKDELLEILPKMMIVWTFVFVVSCFMIYLLIGRIFSSIRKNLISNNDSGFSLVKVSCKFLVERLDDVHIRKKSLYKRLSKIEKSISSLEKSAECEKCVNHIAHDGRADNTENHEVNNDFLDVEETQDNIEKQKVKDID